MTSKRKIQIPNATQIEKECRESLSYAFQEVQEICSEALDQYQKQTKKHTEQVRKLKQTIKDTQKKVTETQKTLKTKSTVTLKNKLKTLTTRLKDATKKLATLEKESEQFKTQIAEIKVIRQFEKERAAATKQFTQKASTSKQKPVATKTKPTTATTAKSKSAEKKPATTAKSKPTEKKSATTAQQYKSSTTVASKKSTEKSTKKATIQPELDLIESLSTSKELLQKELGEGDKAPNFTGEFDEGETVSLNELRGKNIVLYFYPRDNTPGCTQQALDFSDHLEQLRENDTVVIGVSRDNIASHHSFKQQYDITYKLLADVDEKICQAYGVIKDKNMYGKIVKGIERSTFVIDKSGMIRAVWRKVKVPGHIYEVISAVESI